IIYIPILFHTLYGLVVIGYSRLRGMAAYAYPRNALFWWQRFTGIVLILFIFWHAITLRFGVFNFNFISENDPTFKVMAATFNPLVYTAYIIGVIATSYHFCNGLFTAGLTWGITIGPKAQTAAARFWLLMALGMSALWIAIATTFFLGSPNGLAG
ncbi:MAG: succinate dehydrogenase, partial [Chloroflexota bacterium]|nr:succinate dehydrogenase [Chloroflexota bacterium]